MNDYPDLRQEKSYRRGLVLGLTMAEVMILLIFLLLMALAAALANRDRRIEILDQGGASKLLETLQSAYPEAKTPEDFWKELKRAVDLRAEAERAGYDVSDPSRLIKDARTGRAAAQDDRNGRRGEWPPFLSLAEQDGFFFDSGKATLRPEFANHLVSSVIPTLAQMVADYEVDVIEVIGHTDEIPMSGSSNLDRSLIAASRSGVPIAELRSTDNAGLAMARAVAVVHVLRADPRLKDVSILPLSGAQMIVPVDRMADGSSPRDDQSRRRIEIRVRRSTQAAPTT